MPGESLDLASDLCLARRSAFTCRITPSTSLLRQGYFQLWDRTGRSGTFRPHSLPLCKVLCKRNQPLGIAGSLWASFMPQKLPKLTARRTVGNGESSALGRGSRAEAEVGCKSMPLPISLPSRSGPLLCPGGHKLLWVPGLYLTLAQLLQFLRTSPS